MRSTKIALAVRSPGCKIMGCYHVAMKDEVDGSRPVLCLFHQRWARIAASRMKEA